MNAPRNFRDNPAADAQPPIRGRGTATNPTNRFEEIQLEKFAEEEYDSLPNKPKTSYFKETAKSIISTVDSPDVGMEASFNPYRGCEHGCIYCYARPTHEYLGFSAGLDFETKIIFKGNAPELLRKELKAKSWKPKVIASSGVTDCYQPLERKLELTRRCMQVLAEFRNPVVIITKNHLVTRDLDIFQELHRFQSILVVVSVTTLDVNVSRLMEPRASIPDERLAAIKALRKAGIPVSVNVAPIVPGLTDHEIPQILKAAKAAGALTANYVVVRLPYGVKHLFEQWVSAHFPERKEKILNRIKDIRGGKLNDPNFHSRMEGKGIFAEQIGSLFRVSAKKVGLDGDIQLSTEHFRRGGQEQMDFFRN